MFFLCCNPDQDGDASRRVTVREIGALAMAVEARDEMVGRTRGDGR